MERPQSIIWFERFYLGAFALGIASSALGWSSLQEQMGAIPNSQSLPPWFMPVVLIASLTFGLVISLLLWHLVARRGSTVAKVFIVIFFVLGLLGLPSTVMGVSSGLISPLMAIGNIITLALNAAAVWMLFRPDTKPWFDKKTPDLKNTFN